DALKFTLGFMCAQGQDVLIDKDSFKLGSRFCNKVWNASRYLLGNLEGRNLVPVTDADLTELDKWIYSRLNNATKIAREALETYRYNDAASALMEYFWNEFCDWYVEATKINFKNGDDKEKDRQASVLMNILEENLRLLHPYLPFVTEEIYAKLPVKKHEGMLITAPYPEVIASRENPEIEARFEVLKELIGKTRALRVDCGIDPANKINIAIRIEKGSEAEVCREKVEMIQLLAGIAKIDFVDAKPESSIGTVGKGFESFILVDENINKEQLITRFQKTLEKEEGYARMSQNKLNGNFAQHAPAELVQEERDRLAESERKIETLKGYLKELM
ncbi:MAG: class I tRNA ligase family protein, partial [Treponema sp.]|nr:class I tRNA ligase family protein [Treponema sp.]